MTIKKFLTIRPLVTSISITGLSLLLASCQGEQESALSSEFEFTGGYEVNDLTLANTVDGTNWSSYGRTFDESHYSPLDQVDGHSIDRLGLAWSLELDTNTANSQILSIDGVIYTATGLTVVHAIDARSGELLWRYDAEVAAEAGWKMRYGWGIRGLAFWKGRVYVGTQDGRLIALDAETGALNWSVLTTEPGDARFITGAPRAFRDKILIGHGGAEYGPTRGYVTAYDAVTGDQAWRFFLVPGNPADGFENDAMAMAAETWSGEWWKYGGGGTAWNALTYDPEYNQVYIGTGNGAPWNWKIRNPEGGDALFLVSIIALDADTGEYRWHYQTNPNEAWDYNSAMDMVLTSLEVNGSKRNVLLHAPKNGFFYVIDRETGKLISAEKFVETTWADAINIETGRPIEMPNIRYEFGQEVVLNPGIFGGHNWPPMAHSPQTGLTYIPAREAFGSWTDSGVDTDAWQHTPGVYSPGMGAESLAFMPDLGISSSLLAWDPVTQSPAWSAPTPGGWNAGIMATGGNLVFQGHMDGTFNGYDAGNGEKLWSFYAGVAVDSAPISYSLDGEQYISVLSGPPTGSSSAFAGLAGYFWDYRDYPRRLLTFKLDASQPLATTPPRREPAVALNGGGFISDESLSAAGEGIWNERCVMCHGGVVISAGAAPDLRASAIPLSRESFNSVLRGGLLESAGMPRYEELTDNELESLRHYIRREADRSLNL